MAKTETDPLPKILRDDAQRNHPSNILGWQYFVWLVRENIAAEALTNATREMAAKNVLTENAPLLVALAAADKIAKAMPAEIRAAVKAAKERFEKAREELYAAGAAVKAAEQAEQDWLKKHLGGSK